MKSDLKFTLINAVGIEVFSGTMAEMNVWSARYLSDETYYESLKEKWTDETDALQLVLSRGDAELKVFSLEDTRLFLLQLKVVKPWA